MAALLTDEEVGLSSGGLLTDEQVGLGKDSGLLSDADVGLTSEPEKPGLLKQAAVIAPKSAWGGVKRFAGGMLKGVGGLQEMQAAHDVEALRLQAEMERQPGSTPTQPMKVPAAGIQAGIARNSVYEVGQATEDSAPTLTPAEAKSAGGQIGGLVGGGAGMALGPLAVPAYTLDAIGRHVKTDYDELKQRNPDMSDEQAAETALDNGIKAGAVTAAVFEVMPKAMRPVLEKYIVDKFGQGFYSRWLAGRVSAATEVGATMGTATAGENVATGQPAMQGVGTSTATGALTALILPWLRARPEGGGQTAEGGTERGSATRSTEPFTPPAPDDVAAVGTPPETEVSGSLPKAATPIEDLTAAGKDLQATLRGETPESERLKAEVRSQKSEEQPNRVQQAIDEITAKPVAAVGTPPESEVSGSLPKAATPIEQRLQNEQLQAAAESETTGPGAPETSTAGTDERLTQEQTGSPSGLTAGAIAAEEGSGPSRSAPASEPLPSISKPQQDILDRLEALKFKAGERGQMHAFGLLPEGWDKFVDLVKLGVRAGRSLRDAIGWAIEKFKARNPDAKLDEQGATHYLLTSEEPEANKLREQFADERDKGPISEEQANVEADETPATARRPWQEVQKEVEAASTELLQRIRERNPAVRPDGVTPEQSRRAVAAATARWRQLRDSLVRHPDYVAHLHTQMRDLARAMGDETLTPEQRMQAGIEFENVQSELEQVPAKLSDRIANDMVKRGELESRADRARKGLEQELPSEDAARADARPTGPVLEEFGWRERVAELPERARELFNGLKRTREVLANLAARAGNRDLVAYTKDAADNQATLAGQQAGNLALHELNRAFGARRLKDLNARNDLREWALTAVIEAGGKREGIAEAREKILSSQFARTAWARRDLRALDYADEHFARLQPVAELYGKLTDAEVAVENEAGIETLNRKGGYVFHTQDLNAEWGVPDFGGEGGSGPSAPFKHIRDHATYADAIAAGVKPRTLNAVDLLQRRMTLGRKLVNYRAWLDNLRGVTDPKTELPLVTDTVKRQRADGSMDEIPPSGYTIAQLGGQRIALHKGYEGLFTSLTSPSYFRSGTVKPALLNAAGTAKHFLLLFDSFHLGRLAFWQVMTRRGLPGYTKGLTLMDNTVADLKAMIGNGEIPAEWGEAVLERKADLDHLLKAGLNVGGISDNVFSHWVEHIPVTGDFNRWLFAKFQRGAMAEAAMSELDRMRKQFPKLPADVVARRVARDINTRFGNLGNQGWIKSKTGRDLARLIFLAPQWNESLIRSEFGAVRDIVKAPYESYQQGRPAIGTMGLAVGTAALGMFLANQVLNYLTRGKPTWENEEEGFGAKISGYVPDVVGGGPGFFVNSMSLPLEISHLIEKNAEATGGDYSESLRRFMEGRLNTFSRAANTFATRRSFDQGKLRTGSEVAGAMAKDLVPVPLPASGLYRAGKELLTGENEEKYPGQFQQQMMQSAGLKTDRVPSPEQRMRSLATEYNRAKGIEPNAEFFHGDYYELENALRLGNKREQAKALEELLTKKSAAQIRQHWQRWANAPFTGQLARERAFRDGLSEEQRAAYDKARGSRRELADKAKELLPPETETVVVE